MRSLRSKLAIAAAVCALAVCQASAALIFNGGFESGNVGFTTDYEYTTISGGLAGADSPPTGEPDFGEGMYAIGGDPSFYHSSFVKTGPHSGNNMMIVNRSTLQNRTVWSQTIPLIAGQSYVFSAWFLNVYPTSPAQLNITIGGVSFPTYTIPTGGWQEFTRTFTATTTGGAILDVNVLAFGNDFAMDDLTVVPEPGTMIAGALLLLPFAASVIRRFRKNS